MDNEKIKEIPSCPDCGAAMVRGSNIITWRYKRRRAKVEQPFWCCPVSVKHLTVLSDSDRDVVEQIMLHLSTELSPADVRRIRTNLGISQRTASLLLARDLNRFYKYEAGKSAISHMGAVLLRILDRHPELLDEIRKDTLDRW